MRGGFELFFLLLILFTTFFKFFATLFESAHRNFEFAIKLKKNETMVRENLIRVVVNT